MRLIFEAWIRYRPKTERGKSLSCILCAIGAAGLNNYSEDNNSSSQNNMKELFIANKSRKLRKTFNERYPINQVEQEIMKEEKKIVQKFLSKFVANPELSNLQLIDLAKMIKGKSYELLILHTNSFAYKFQFKQCNKNRYHQYEKYAAISYWVSK